MPKASKSSEQMPIIYYWLWGQCGEAAHVIGAVFKVLSFITSLCTCCLLQNQFAAHLARMVVYVGKVYASVLWTSQEMIVQYVSLPCIKPLLSLYDGQSIESTSTLLSLLHGLATSCHLFWSGMSRLPYSLC